ncbi:MAG: septum formation initiator family protein [Eubacterium sp.]|nr:septum formation initiator family protein [Eubacterium sp.]
MNKKAYIKLAIIAGICLLAIYSSFSLINNAADISRLKAQSVKYDKEYAQQVEDNDKIKAILNSKDKDAYIEQKAREKGYVKEGEIVFYDISSTK